MRGRIACAARPTHRTWGQLLHGLPQPHVVLSESLQAHHELRLVLQLLLQAGDARQGRLQVPEARRRETCFQLERVRAVSWLLIEWDSVLPDLRCTAQRRTAQQSAS